MIVVTSMASGHHLLSAGARPDVVGECDPDSRPVFGVNSTSGLNVQFMTGTSMACPGAAGAGILVRQYFMDGWFPTGSKVADNEMTPSGTLIKAVLVNGAEGMTAVNQRDGSTTPVALYDNNIGFGRINLQGSLPLEDVNDFRAFMKDQQPISQNQIDENVFYIDTDECSRNFISATLVWADPPGALGCTHCLINDLDLEVVKNNNLPTYPNGQSSKDDTNNVERIQIPVSHGDIVQVAVKGANLAQSPQTYSLIVTGCIEDYDPSRPSAAPSITAVPTGDYVKHPSSVPTIKTSTSPSAEPSKSLLPSIAPTDNCGNFRIDLQIDLFGYETYWEVLDKNQRVMYIGNTYRGNTFYSIQRCLPKEETYTFTIYDVFGDGICCDWGNGYYELYNNDILIEEGGEFGWSESKQFLFCFTEECFER